MNLGMKKAFGKFGGQHRKHADSDEEFDATLNNITNDLEQSPSQGGEKASTIFRMKATLGRLSMKGKKMNDGAANEEDPIESIAATADLSPNLKIETFNTESTHISAQIHDCGNLIDDDPERWEHEESLTPGAARRRVSEVLEFESAIEHDDSDDAVNTPASLPQKSGSANSLPAMHLATEESHGRPKSLSSHHKLSKPLLLVLNYIPKLSTALFNLFYYR